MSLDSDVAQDVVQAERDLLATSVASPGLNSTEGIARLLLRCESVASSHIEGLSIGTRRLLRAELFEQEPDNLRFDKSALAVLGNIHAMSDAIAMADSEVPVTTETICEIHRSLCSRTNIEQFGGVVRTRQNWVGGSSYNPLSADYVPPAPEHVAALLDDLAAFCNRDDLSAVEQAAMAHAQFEAIHPFADGNGRTGRALIHLVLRRRGVCPVFAPPISLVLATEREEYMALLGRMHVGDDPRAEHEAVNEWVSFFAACARSACAESMRLAQELDEMEAMWRESLGTVRSGSALEAIMEEMRGMPVFSINSMRRLCGRSQPAVSEAVRRLLDAGIVRVTTKGKRNRVFEVPDVISVFGMLERRLASPAMDTALEPPSRPVPVRPDVR
jgi:Fic family protein